MLIDAVVRLYNKYCLFFYKRIFADEEAGEEQGLPPLTTVESFSMECIRMLGEPSVQEFAHMMGISAPNAAYKVNALMEKGYIEKVQSEIDRREYHLRPTERFWERIRSTREYAETVVRRCEERFSKEDLEKLENMLTIVESELMPELEKAEEFRSVKTAK